MATIHFPIHTNTQNYGKKIKLFTNLLLFFSVLFCNFDYDLIFFIILFKVSRKTRKKTKNQLQQQNKPTRK